ncbi:MAG: hypothetical protein HQL76_08205 [Magnetococcales bacterium]|nr:hypothetical protein [Magnetococcales bacterium]
MAIMLQHLENWLDKENLVTEAEKIALADDLTRSGRKMRMLREAFSVVGPVETVMDRILEERLFHAHQHFLDRRAMDLLRGRKDMKALQDYRIQQLQKTGDLLRQSLEQARQLLEGTQNQFQGVEERGLLMKMMSRQRANEHSLEKNIAQVADLQNKDMAFCTLHHSSV